MPAAYVHPSAGEMAKVTGMVTGWLRQATLTAHTRWPLQRSIKEPMNYKDHDLRKNARSLEDSYERFEY
jgi:hypothetical protein